MICSCLSTHPAAPITAANLLLNAKSGLYNGAPLSVSGNAVLVDAPAGTRSAAGAAAAGAAQAAEADADADASAEQALSGGGGGGGGSGRQRASPAALPLEILAQGEFEPLYRSPLDVRSGELPVLPLSIYGAGEQRVCGVARLLRGGAALACCMQLELRTVRLPRSICNWAPRVLLGGRAACGGEAGVASCCSRFHLLAMHCSPTAHAASLHPPPIHSGHGTPAGHLCRLRERPELLHLQVRPAAGGQPVH